eukprot:12913042-Prorocentrum_lima.AAC.1
MTSSLVGSEMCIRDRFVGAGDWEKLPRGEGEPQGTLSLNKGSPSAIRPWADQPEHERCFGWVDVDEASRMGVGENGAKILVRA